MQDATSSEDGGSVNVAADDGLLVVTISRPKKLNAMTEGMVEQIIQAALRFGDDATLRVMLIRAEGRYFSAGMDVSGGRPTFAGSSYEARRYYRGIGIQRLGEILETVEKPVVVAHHAACLGGALELSLSCDFRLASDAATYGLPEINIGVLPGSGGTSRLTRLLGPHWARWLILAGETISAQRALEVGLIHDVYPAAEFEQRVSEFCRKLGALPPEAFAIGKLAIELATDLERGQGRNVERLANSVLFIGEERQQRLNAFLNRKRDPHPGGD